MEVSLRQLRAADLVAEVGGFTLAAARLKISQPAVTRLVTTLESELGARLARWRPPRPNLASA